MRQWDYPFALLSSPSGYNTMSEELEQLRALINSSIDNIIAACDRKQETFPSLFKPVDPSKLSTADIRHNPDVVKAVAVGVSAAAQLIATLQPPAVTLNISALRVRVSC